MEVNDSMHGNEDAVDKEEKAELDCFFGSQRSYSDKQGGIQYISRAIPSVLKSNEVLVPDAKKRICGIFKSVPVYRRSDVHTSYYAKKWLYQGRIVKEQESKNPAKKVKARKKPTPKGFEALHSYGVGAQNDGSEEARQRDIAKGTGVEEENDGMQKLYAFWQTMPWSPIPVGPNDPIPTNEYNNVEL